MRAIIVWGGWSGHQPDQVAEIFRREISEMGGTAEVYDSLDAFEEKDLSQYDLIVPVWTMGEISKEQSRPSSRPWRPASASPVATVGCATRFENQWAGSL